MFKVFCVTNSALSKGDFCERLKRIAPLCDGIILREKELNGEEYFALSQSLLKEGIPIILHKYASLGRALGIEKVHLSFADFCNLSEEDKKNFTYIGVSCHSLEEARIAEDKGASAVVLGHIFQTECKRGLFPRGVDFLKSVCGGVHIPVYAIGGINKQNVHLCRDFGASGVCVMSGPMQCDDVNAYFEGLRI